MVTFGVIGVFPNYGFRLGGNLHFSKFWDLIISKIFGISKPNTVPSKLAHYFKNLYPIKTKHHLAFEKMILFTTWKHWSKNHKYNDQHSLHFDKNFTFLDTTNLSAQGCYD